MPMTYKRIREQRIPTTFIDATETQAESKVSMDEQQSEKVGA